MELNKTYLQSYTNTYCVPIRRMKNGGYYGLYFEHYDNRASGKVKKGSLKGWHPAPTLCNDVPEKVATKLATALQAI